MVSVPKASVLNRTLTAFRIGSADNQHPIFNGIGAKLYPGRWNKIGNPVIYCAEHYSLAILEKLVHTNTGDIPTNQQWIKITIPVGITYECVTANSLADWTKESVSQNFGSKWLKSQRSCILIVPSIIAQEDNNILINESHPQFHQITTSLNRPVVWDKRLFSS